MLVPSLFLGLGSFGDLQMSHQADPFFGCAEWRMTDEDIETAICHMIVWYCAYDDKVRSYDLHWFRVWHLVMVWVLIISTISISRLSSFSKEWTPWIWNTTSFRIFSICANCDLSLSDSLTLRLLTHELHWLPVTSSSQNSESETRGLRWSLWEILRKLDSQQPATQSSAPARYTCYNSCSNETSHTISVVDMKYFSVCAYVCTQNTNMNLCVCVFHTCIYHII